MKKENNNTNINTNIKNQEEKVMKTNKFKEMIMAEAETIKNEEVRNLTIRVRTQRAIDALHDQWNRVCMHIDNVSAEEMSEEYAEFIRKINYADRLISNASGQGELTDINYGRNIYEKQVRTHRDSEDIHIQKFINEWDRVENEVAEIRAEIQELRDMWKAAGGYDLWEQHDEDELALSEIDLDTEETIDVETERQERESLERGWAELIEMEKAMNEAKVPSKKDEMIETVENTYDMVGAARTIKNYTGIGEDDFESSDIQDIVSSLFSEDEKEEQRNKDILIDYYKSQPEEFFMNNDEDKVIRMAEDLSLIKYNDLVIEYGFKEFYYEPGNEDYPETAIASIKNEVVQAFPRFKAEMDKTTFNRVIKWCRKIGMENWKYCLYELDSLLGYINDGYSPEEQLNIIIANTTISGR